MNNYTDWTLNRKTDIKPVFERPTLVVFIKHNVLHINKVNEQPIKYSIPIPNTDLRGRDFITCCLSCVPPIHDFALAVAEKMDGPMSAQFVAHVDGNRVPHDNPGLVFEAITTFTDIEWGIARELFITSVLESVNQDPRGLVELVTGICLAYGYAKKPLHLPCSILVDCLMNYHKDVFRGLRNNLFMLLVRRFSSVYANRQEVIHSLP